jgi:hypothetical protein
MSALNVFCTQLINFFDELASAIPEEKDIKTALEMIKMAKTANPRLMADLFYENFYVDFNTIIMNRDIDGMITLGKTKIQSSYNELSPAIMIFDKHWTSLSSVSQDAIWKYMQLLCKLVVKTR